MRLTRAYQFHPVIADGDAIGNDAFALERLLWARGARSRIYAAHAHDEVAAFVRPWRDLFQEPRDGALLLLRHSMGNDCVDEVGDLPLPKVLRYHNITPARYFVGLNEDLRKYSELGREQLRGLASKCEMGIADSEYSRKELEASGYAKTAVVPILVDRNLFEQVPDPVVAARLADGHTHLLVVGQIVPQKAQHLAVAAFARYRQSDPAAHLWLVGRADLAGGYLEQVRAEIARLRLRDAVTLTGLVSSTELLAYYKGTTALLTLSEHEGFCVPLLEAMRAELPIVARNAAAIPDTLGDAGLLLDDVTPDAVAAALERVVKDRTLRRDLTERGRRHLARFTPEAVGRALMTALAQIGWELGGTPSRRITVLSSDERCGIHDYSQAIVEGLRANDHQVDFVGVKHVDSADLATKIGMIPKDTEVVIIEHENGIFRDLSFVLALLRLWFRRVRIVLSMHEIEPEKFHHYRRLSAALHYRPVYAWPLELGRIFWVALLIASYFIRYRLVLTLMGALPAKLIVHSDRTEYWTDLLTSERGKIEQHPLVIMPLEDALLPTDEAARRELRRELGLPLDGFILVSPGFFFRRKRFIEVARAAPPEVTVVFSGTESSWDAGYLGEVQEYVHEHGLTNVVINTDFALMGKHVAAADGLVLFYAEQFQSAIATQAVWAGLPCIYSDHPAFRLYRGAGLVAKDEEELRLRMREIQDPATYARLRRQVALLRRMLAPERNAPRYLAGL
ncbi:MAG: glycosyltransferase [Chloroflexi bacterium]|nr:glycosyltransferase [Chloroflexota bacterium]